MFTKVITKNMQSNGDHLSCLSFAEYIGHVILAPKS